MIDSAPRLRIGIKIGTVLKINCHLKRINSTSSYKSGYPVPLWGTR